MSREKLDKPDSYWQDKLTPEEFHITRRKGTERAFTGDYWRMDGSDGTYTCKCCGEPLFSTADKFDSGCGWPSFTAPVTDENVGEAPDNSFGMRRTEILCSRCDAHLGHVFPDGPAPTGLRYCVNSASLDFQEKGQAED